MPRRHQFDPGCYVDGARGIYATDAIVEFAVACGAKIEHDNCDAHGETCFDSTFAGCEFASEYEDEATEYMENRYPLVGHYWGRNYSGDWGLWPEEED